MLWAWAVSAALAAPPLPSFTDDRVLYTWSQVNSLIESACVVDARTGQQACNPEPLQLAIDKASAWMDQVRPDARLHYLVGLAHRGRGEDAKATAAYEAAIALDPKRQDAWHDLGELRLASGDLRGAKKAFEEVAELVPDGPASWVGPYRLAEVAAFEHQPAAFEVHMKEALRRGFTFRQIAHLPAWKGFYADPKLRDTVEKLILVYGTHDILESLK